YEIVFRRKGRMQMPIDFTVTTTDGKKYNYHIPNTWFTKKTDATILPKWYGWDLLEPMYAAIIKLPSKIKTVEIDPSHYLADMDWTNNKWGHGGIHTLELENNVHNVTTWTQQKNFWRPDLWYNSYDGVQAGLHANGSYLGKNSYRATFWYNTRLGQWNTYPSDVPKKNQPLAFDLASTHNLTKLWKDLEASESAYYNAGIW